MLVVETRTELVARVAEILNRAVGGLVEAAEELLDDKEKALTELHEDRDDHGENEDVLSRRLSRLIF